MAAERNFFHRWRGMTTIGYELGVIWEMSDNLGDYIVESAMCFLYAEN